MPSTSDLALAEKTDLRRIARGHRRHAHAMAGAVAPSAVRDAFLKVFATHAGEVLTLYAPIGDELDPTPLAVGAAAAGFRTALPVIPARGKLLSFHAWQPGTPLPVGRYGIPAPSGDAPLLEPDIVIVPVLAFDAAGNRLGYGGGYYDATLTRLRAARRVLAVGIAFADQEVPTVPATDHDQRLDWVVTERGARRFDRTPSDRG